MSFFYAPIETNTLAFVVARGLICICMSLQQLNGGNREQFLADCKSGVYDGVLAISRTFDSIKVNMNRNTPEHAIDLRLIARVFIS